MAIERSGRAVDGNYYNMRGTNVKHLVDPIDDLFIAAKNITGIMTTGGLQLLKTIVHFVFEITGTVCLISSVENTPKSYKKSTLPLYVSYALFSRYCYRFF